MFIGDDYVILTKKFWFTIEQGNENKSHYLHLIFFVVINFPPIKTKIP